MRAVADIGGKVSRAKSLPKKDNLCLDYGKLVTSDEPIIYCVEFETRKDQNAKLKSTVLNGKARAIKFLE